MWPPNASEGKRAGTALFAVSVRSTAGVGRTTDTLRYLYAASPLQRLLRFYREHRTMARRSATSKCQFGARVAEAPSWLGLYHLLLGRRRRLQAVWHRSGAEEPSSYAPSFGGEPSQAAGTGRRVALTRQATNMHRNLVVEGG